MIVLDTNVLSGLVRGERAPSLLAWFQARDRSILFTTAITEAEIFYGLAIMPNGRRRAELMHAMETLFAEGLSGRVLPFDRGAARAFADIAARRRRIGRLPAVPDMQIAAIARSRDASAIATRNVPDFEGCGVPIVNPWMPAERA